jgi:hypothetical protein
VRNSRRRGRDPPRRGLADLLAAAAAGTTPFAALVCARTSSGPAGTPSNARKLEKKLSRVGIPLFATDEPAVIEGLNAVTGRII